MMLRLAAFGVVLLVAAAAFSQAPPQGVAVYNQALAARVLTKSDSTVLRATRGIFIGDAAACNVALVLAGDTAAVTFTNMQPGSDHPYSIIKLMSTNTTCASVVALY